MAGENLPFLLYIMLKVLNKANNFIFLLKYLVD